MTLSINGASSSTPVPAARLAAAPAAPAAPAAQAPAAPAPAAPSAADPLAKPPTSVDLDGLAVPEADETLHAGGSGYGSGAGGSGTRGPRVV